MARGKDPGNFERGCIVGALLCCRGHCADMVLVYLSPQKEG